MLKQAIWNWLHWNTYLTPAWYGNCSQACRDKYDDNSPSCLLETLPNPTNSLCPLPTMGFSNLTALKSKEIREASIASVEAYRILSPLALFLSSFMNGLQPDYNCFLFICITVSENTDRPDIFHTYIVWFSLNNKKIQHYLLLNETQKDSPSPKCRQL